MRDGLLCHQPAQQRLGARIIVLRGSHGSEKLLIGRVRRIALQKLPRRRFRNIKLSKLQRLDHERRPSRQSALAALEDVGERDDALFAVTRDVIGQRPVERDRGVARRLAAASVNAAFGLVEIAMRNIGLAESGEHLAISGAKLNRLLERRDARFETTSLEIERAQKLIGL